MKTFKDFISTCLSGDDPNVIHFEDKQDGVFNDPSAKQRATYRNLDDNSVKIKTSE